MNKCLNCGKHVKNKYCGFACQNMHQGEARAIARYGEYKLFAVECNKCKTTFEVKEREKLFPQKDIYHCSRACANSRIHTQDTKDKIAKTLRKNPIIEKRIKEKKIREKNEKIVNCLHCNKETTNSKFCSRSCNTTYGNLNGNGRKAGLASVKAQSENRRSKNEIYFGKLCHEKFESVLFNEQMFNGWDADVIIPELKIAVLWNGRWHYEKIKEKHSVLQVQNRDKIKEEEIIKAGYKSYVIKDMGKYNKSFVEKEFQKFLCFL